MKLMNQKNKKFAKVFTVLFTIAVVTSLTALTAFAAGGAGGGGGSEAAYQSTIEFFITWIRRIGMMVAFVGAIMFALAIKNNDAEQKQAGLITMIAGFIVARSAPRRICSTCSADRFGWSAPLCAGRAMPDPRRNAMQILPALAAILPNTGAPENPAYLAQTGLTFFGTWISRIGGLVAFIGAIKFALSIKSDETRDQLPALLTMVSGFMIQAAISNLGIFELATTNAETIFQNILLFIGRWTRRVGAAGTLVGAVMFGFSVKDNNAVGKVAALKTFAAGAIVVSVSGILHTFV